MSPEDTQRYTQQFQHIQEITQLYEQEPDNFPKLINLLQQVCGLCTLSTPSALVPQAYDFAVAMHVCVPASLMAACSETERGAGMSLLHKFVFFGQKVVAA